MRFYIESMHCDGCVRSITRALQQLDTDAHISADLAKHQVDITSSASVEKIIATLASAGFPAQAR